MRVCIVKESPFLEAQEGNTRGIVSVFFADNNAILYELMPPTLSGQSLLTFPDILQPGGESYSEPVESDGHKTGLFGDAMKDVRQCARTHIHVRLRQGRHYTPGGQRGR